MKKSNKLFLLFILVGLLACGNEEASNPAPPTDDFTQEVIDIFQPMVDDDNTVGVAVGLIRPGGEKQMFFFGEKTRGQGDTPDANTLFEIGSITKTMTATVLADMVRKGEISLDDAVENYLPEVNNFPNYNGQKITFKHLANHTSAFPRLPDNLQRTNNFDPNQPYLNYGKELMIEFLGDYVLPYPIGSQEEYSNFGVSLLGYTLAKIKGKPLEELFQEIIFDELAMTTATTLVPANYDNVAQPYDEDLNAVEMWNMSEATLGAGGVKASLKDMMQYLEANLGYGNSDLNNTLALTHETTQTLNPPFNVGLAWTNFYNQADNTTLTWHNGGTAGTVTVMGFVKDLDMGFVIMFNTEVVYRTGTELIELRKGTDLIRLMKKYKD